MIHHFRPSLSLLSHYWRDLWGRARATLLVNTNGASVTAVGAESVLGAVAVALADGAVVTDMDAVGAGALAEWVGL